MNHSYRVVFNESTNTYTAVAEIAKARGKKSKSSKAAAVVAVGLSLGFASNAFAAQTTAQGTKNVVEASGTAVYGNYNAVAGIGAQMIVVGNSNDVGGKANARSTTETVGGYEIDPSAGLTETDASATSNSRNTVVIGNVNTVANSASAVVLGRGITMTNADRAISMGLRSSVTQADAVALGSFAQAAGKDSLAMGSYALAAANGSLAIGSNSNVTGNQSISVGVGNQVSGSQSGAFGDPSIISGAGSYTVGNDNAIGSTSTNVGAFGNNNQIGATATYNANDKLDATKGLTNTAAVAGSRVVGNYNTVTTNETFVLGNNVTTTADNSVFLGSKSAYTAKGTSTDGIGAVTGPVTVNGVSYGDFAGATSVGVVSVGAVGTERRIQNVAAGLISATSTDAINGSQLYLVASGLTHQMPVIYTDTDGNKVYKQPDGTFVDADGNVVDAADVIASMNDGNNSTTDPMTLTNIASNLPNTYNTDAYNPHGNAVTKSQTLPVDAQGNPLNVNNAATVGDILNAGWNLQGNGQAKDFVKAYDTVNFINGDATKAIVTTADDGKSSTVKYDVEVDGTTIKIENGKLTAIAKGTNTVTTVTAGDNIKVTPATDANGNIAYTVATKPDVKFDSVTVGPVVINKDGINAGDTKITNVKDGDISANSKDAVNGSQLYAVKNELNTSIAAAKTVVESTDKSVGITPSTNAAGATVYDLSVKTDGTTIKKNTDGSLAVNTTPLTNNTDGTVKTPAAPNAIATAGDVANAINNSGFSLTAQGSNGSLVKPGATVDMNNTDGNIVISKSASDNNVTYNLAKDVKVDSVTAGDTVVNNDGITIDNGNTGGQSVSITKDGLNNGGNRITNVAPGEGGTDAVNVNQLNALKGDINHVGKKAYAGVAGAIAQGSIPQVTRPGATGVGIGGGYYGGESAVAIGMSSMSDGGNWIIKGNLSTNTNGNVGVGAGALYQW